MKKRCVITGFQLAIQLAAVRYLLLSQTPSRKGASTLHFDENCIISGEKKKEKKEDNIPKSVITMFVHAVAP